MTMTYDEVLALTQANSKAIDKLTASIAEMSANARAEQARRDKESAERAKESAERAKEFAAEQARRDKESAERAKESAERAKEFAAEQARRDKESAERAKESAERAKEFAAEQARRDKESAERAKESAERAKEFAAEQARRDKENAERAKENAELAKEFAKSQARWDSFMERYGGYVDNESRNTEIFFIEGLWQQDLVVGDIKFDDLIANSQHWRKKVVAIELDGLLTNGTTVGILEIKSTLHIKDVERVRDKRIARFREFYTEHSDKKLAVIVAGKLINPDAADLARELGYIILKPNHQGISVDASCYRAA